MYQGPTNDSFTLTASLVESMKELASIKQLTSMKAA